MTATGDVGERYEVSATEDFSLWESFATLTNQFGSAQAVDTGATNRARRFFRAWTAP